MAKPASRAAFSRQPVHVVLIDVCPPTNVQTVSIVCDCLSNVLTLAAGIRGSARIPALGIMALGDRAECVFPLTSVRSNTMQLRSAIGELKNLTTNASARNELDLAVTRQGIQETLQQYWKFAETQKAAMKSSEYINLEITLVSQRDGNLLTGLANQALETINISLGMLKKVQVLSITSVEFAVSQTSENNHNNNEDMRASEAGGLVDLVTLDADALQLEKFFKAWLHDCFTNVEHLKLVFNKANSGNEIPLVIKCDLQEPMLHPAAFAFFNNLFLSTDPLLSQGFLTTASKSLAIPELPVYELEIVSLMHADGVCESVVFGVPLLLHPTCCWRMDWTDLEINTRKFLALCRLMKTRDVVLLLRAEPRNVEGVRGHFVGIGGNGTILVKPVVTRELVLPPLPIQMDPSSVDEESLKIVSSQLDRLHVHDKLNPIRISAGLLKALNASFGRVGTTTTTTNNAGGKKSATLGVRTDTQESSHGQATTKRRFRKLLAKNYPMLDIQ